MASPFTAHDSTRNGQDDIQETSPPNRGSLMSEGESTPLLLPTPDGTEEPPTLDLTPPSTSTSSSVVGSDDFGDFVDAATQLPSPTSLDPLSSATASSFDPLSSTIVAPTPSAGHAHTSFPNDSYSSLPLADSPQPSASSKAPKSNLVDDILKHDQGGMSLFSDPVFEERKQHERLPSLPPAPPPKYARDASTSRVATPTPSSFNDHPQITSNNNNDLKTDTLGPDTSYTPPLSPGALLGTTLTTHPLSSKSPSPMSSRSSTRPPPKLTTPQALAAADSLGDETDIIAKHLGLIDDGYFVGREPAEALSIPIPSPRSRSKSASSFVTGLGGSGGAGAGSGGASNVRPGSPLQTRSPPKQVAAPPITSSGEEWDGILGGDEHVGLGRRRRSGGGSDFDAESPGPPRRNTSFGTLGGILGLLRGSTGPVEDEREGGTGQARLSVHQQQQGQEHQHQHQHPASNHQHQHGSRPHIASVFTSTPPPIQPTIPEERLMDYTGSNANSTPTTNQNGQQSDSTAAAAVGRGSGGGVHGHTGRPLPHARPSLESIQHRWKIDSPSPSSSASPSSTPHIPERKPASSSEPVTITHASAFGPPPPGSSVYAGGAALNAGFGSSSYSSSTAGIGIGTGGASGSSPFGTHAFVPIAGAPGFKPDAYDWDKGYSDELEEELLRGASGGGGGGGGEGGPSSMGGGQLDAESRRRQAEEKEKRDRGRQPERYQQWNGSGSLKKEGGGSLLYQTLGSKFGFGGWGSSSSSFSSTSSSGSSTASSTVSSKTTTARGGGGNTMTVPVRAGHDWSGHVRSATTPVPSKKGQAVGVGELLEKKIGGVELKARKETTLGVLTVHLTELLRPHLPPLSRLSRAWTLLYSVDQHGISLNTLYAKCEEPEKGRKTGQPYVGMGGAVVVLRDAEAEADADADGGASVPKEKGEDDDEDEVVVVRKEEKKEKEKSAFGAFIAEGVGRKAKGFYGGGDSFLWKYDASKDELKVFKTTGRNSYFAICDSEYIGFGGGSTAYGLWLDPSLLEGSSAPCPTFGNEVLCSQPLPNGGGGAVRASHLGKEVEFECVGLEVWGVGPT